MAVQSSTRYGKIAPFFLPAVGAVPGLNAVTNIHPEDLKN